MGALHEELMKLSISCACSWCAVHEEGEEGRRKERRKEKEAKERKKRKKYGKFFQT
jgi:hypothetical protein